MTLRVVAEIWNLVRDTIPDDIRQEITDGMIAILIDNDYNLDDVRHEFSDDGEVQESIKYYADEDDGEYDEWADDDIERAGDDLDYDDDY